MLLKKISSFLFFCLIVACSAYALNQNISHKAPKPILYGTQMLHETNQALTPIFHEAKHNKWAKALDMAHRNNYLKKNPFWKDAFLWYYLSSDNTQPSYEEFEHFLFRHMDWPEIQKLQKRGELALIRELDKKDTKTILRWFTKFEPKTQKGRIAYLNALQDEKKIQEAHDYIQQAWILGEFSSQEEQAFLTQYARDLNPESHLKRAQRLMDQAQKEQVQRMFKVLPASYIGLYEVRLSILSNPDSLEPLLKRLPKQMENDPGLLMDRLSFYHKKNENDEAQKLLLEHQPDSQYRTKWENIRHIQAREAMKEKRYEACYQIMKRHSYESGEKYADFEFFCGWIALSYLKRPDDAQKHFMNLLNSVKSSISLARAYYWLGRADSKAESQKWYQKASQYGWTFYGQLAANEAQLKPNLTPIKPSLLPETKRHLVQFAQFLFEKKEEEKAGQIARHISFSLKEAGQILTLSHLANKINLKPLAVRLARDAQNKTIGIALEAYPRLALLDQMPVIKKQEVENALVHALILQESRFDPKAVSSANAKGFMQLMNDTAKRTANKNKIVFQPHRIFDPRMNLNIGTHHVKELLEEYNGAYPIMLAGYNAGPNPATRWRQEFGDPLSGEVEIIDWIESITYGETRNYVQRVLENLYVYRTLHKMHPTKAKIQTNEAWWKNWRILSRQMKEER